MPFADADRVSLYYEEHGEAEPLLCIMGLAADHLSWAQAPEFNAAVLDFIADAAVSA